MKTLLFFRDGIGFSFWHRFGKPHGTAIRFLRIKPGLFGIRISQGGFYLGAWWTVRIELVAIHISRFSTTP